MRRLRELLRLKYDAGLPHRAIAQACGVGLGTVSAYLQRATAAGLTWPLPDGLDDTALEALLFRSRPRSQPETGWSLIGDCCIRNGRSPASRWPCSGWSIVRSIRPVWRTASFASGIANGRPR